LGFLRNDPGYLGAARAAGELDPVKEAVLHHTRGRLDSYAYVDTNPFRTVGGELVASSRAARLALVREAERRGRNPPVAFQPTSVSDDRDRFHRQGYTIVDRGGYGRVAHRLGSSWSSSAARAQFATTNPRFLGRSGDRF
jgi:hypothetical protein